FSERFEIFVFAKLKTFKMKGAYPDVLDYNAMSWQNYQSQKVSFGVCKFYHDGKAIWLQYTNDTIYRYGLEQITAEEMATLLALAGKGQGLSSFINKNLHIRNAYGVIAPPCTSTVTFILLVKYPLI
ncbi:MAG TPA: hypothetical protein VD927_13605, partial [Chryseosolibacter sp.]|nr:hypothetical protein [Chryseosolibacter sp.]